MDLRETNVKVTEGLFWEIKQGIEYDEKSETFLDYLLKEKEKFDHPRPRNQKLLAVFTSLLLGFFCLITVLFFIDLVSVVLLGTFVNPEELRILPPEISAGLLISTAVATILGISFTIITIIYKVFLSKSKWSSYHDQMISLFRRLESAGLLEFYITLNKTNGKKRFQLQNISIDFNLEWIFPFIFDDFPPLLFELLLLSFLLPFFVVTSISLFFSLLDFEFFYFLFMIMLLLSIFLGFEQSGIAIYKSWKKYSVLSGSLISKQQEVIHSLVLEEKDELTIIRHQNNLKRLISIQSFPLPQLIRFSAVIPLLGSLVGYLIALTAVM